MPVAVGFPIWKWEDVIFGACAFGCSWSVTYGCASADLFRGSWVQTSGSDQFVAAVRRTVWEVGAEFRGSELVAVVCCWLWRLPGLVVLLRSFPVLVDSGDRIL